MANFQALRRAIEAAPELIHGQMIDVQGRPCTYEQLVRDAFSVERSDRLAAAYPVNAPTDADQIFDRVFVPRFLIHPSGGMQALIGHNDQFAAAWTDVQPIKQTVLDFFAFAERNWRMRRVVERFDWLCATFPMNDTVSMWRKALVDPRDTYYRTALRYYQTTDATASEPAFLRQRALEAETELWQGIRREWEHEMSVVFTARLTPEQIERRGRRSAQMLFMADYSQLGYGESILTTHQKMTFKDNVALLKTQAYQSAVLDAISKESKVLAKAAKFGMMYGKSMIAPAIEQKVEPASSVLLWAGADVNVVEFEGKTFEVPKGVKEIKVMKHRHNQFIDGPKDTLVNVDFETMTLPAFHALPQPPSKAPTPPDVSAAIEELIAPQAPAYKQCYYDEISYTPEMAGV